MFVEQIYLDFGLAIPKLSVHGMLSAVKDLLELCPLNKVIMFLKIKAVINTKVTRQPRQSLT